jgi:hypothetical protein
VVIHIIISCKMIEDEIVELKPTTIAYLLARPGLAPRRFVYSGQAMIVSPHSGANYLVRIDLYSRLGIPSESWRESTKM